MDILKKIQKKILKNSHKNHEKFQINPQLPKFSRGLKNTRHCNFVTSTSLQQQAQVDN